MAAADAEGGDGEDQGRVGVNDFAVGPCGGAE